LPASDDLLHPSGPAPPNFEGGSIDFDPATGVATLRPAITLLQIQPGGSITLNPRRLAQRCRPAYSSAEHVTRHGSRDHVEYIE
jgi:hypothetical protein